MRLNRAVVINLPRQGRAVAFQERWLAAGQPVRLGLHPAIDGQVLQLPDSWKPAGAAAYGQYLSHLSALAQGEGPMLVLEDDAEFSHDFRDQLRAMPEPPHPDWHILYLGGELVTPHPPLPEADAPRAIVHAPRGVRGTYGYVVRNPAMLAARLRLFEDRGLRLSDALTRAGLVTYAYAPFMVRELEEQAEAA